MVVSICQAEGVYLTKFLNRENFEILGQTHDKINFFFRYFNSARQDEQNEAIIWNLKISYLIFEANPEKNDKEIHSGETLD